jgi:transcriptional repressor NrdR
MVIKRGGRREPWERSKLERGIIRALEKRPVSQLTIENLVNEIEDEAAMKGKTANEIPSTDLGEMVLDKLYTLDKVSYVRFASVYRKFETVVEFLEVINRLDEGTERMSQAPGHAPEARPARDSGPD